jgi:hypothetical protein
MDGAHRERERRPVLIHTLRGAVEGWLDASPRARTLDLLNRSRRFVAVENAEVAASDWSFENGRLDINKEQILFVAELTDDPPATDDRVDAVHFNRNPVSLRLADFDVRGYLHARGRVDPALQLSRSREPFLAMTSASVVGPDFELAAGFIAVNPTHVLAVQPMAPADRRDAE